MCVLYIIPADARKRFKVPTTTSDRPSGRISKDGLDFVFVPPRAICRHSRLFCSLSRPKEKKNPLALRFGSSVHETASIARATPSFQCTQPYLLPSIPIHFIPPMTTLRTRLSLSACAFYTPFPLSIQWGQRAKNIRRGSGTVSPLYSLPERRANGCKEELITAHDPSVSHRFIACRKTDTKIMSNPKQ